MSLTPPAPPRPAPKGEILKPKKNKWSREYRVKSPAITLGSMGLGDAYDEL